MKRGMIGVLTALLALSVVGCGGNGEDSTKKQEETPLPPAIEALLSEGQLDAPAYTPLPQYAPANLNDARIQAISFENVAYKGEKTQVFAYLGIPDGASSENPVPGVVLVHGGGGTAFPEWVQMWVDAGYAAIAFDTDGNCNPSGGSAWSTTGSDPDDLFKGPANDWLSSSFRPIKEQWIYHAVSAAMNAQSLLRRLPAVADDKIGITGISWGGVITSIAMGVDTRFRFAVPVYCNGCFRDGIARMDKDYWDDKATELWEPSLFFDRVKADVLFLNSDHDGFHSLNATNAAHAKLKDSWQTILPNLVHGHIQAWEVKETMAFADAAVGKSVQKLVRVASQEVSDRTVKLTFRAEQGVEVVRAEMYAVKGEYAYTLSSNKADGGVLKEDFEKVAEQTQIGNGEVTIPLPSDVRHFYVNLITADGFVSSSVMQKAA